MFSQNNFNLLVDTGSANTAIVTANCCSQTSTSLYSCSASSSCVDQSETISVNYITGSWSGALVDDTFSSAELGVIDNIPFTEILTESGFAQEGYDGIIGLCFDGIASPQSNPPVPYFDTIQQDRDLPKIFSILMCGALQPLLNGSVTTEEDLLAGKLLLGGSTGNDGTKYYENELVYTPLVQKKWYNIIITGLSVGEKKLDIDCRDINTPRVSYIMCC